jgi:hypothetical protein
LLCGTSYGTELGISRLADSQVGEQPGMSCPHLSSPRYPQPGTLITTPERLILARCGDGQDIVPFLAAGQDADQGSARGTALPCGVRARASAESRDHQRPGKDQKDHL